MGFEVSITCDGCGKGVVYEDSPVSYSFEKRNRRNYGWQIGKKGWLCPKCRTRKSKKVPYDWGGEDSEDYSQGSSHI